MHPDHDAQGDSRHEGERKRTHDHAVERAEPPARRGSARAAAGMARPANAMRCPNHESQLRGDLAANMD